MIIADTGFWVALANHRDRDHMVCKQVLAKITEPLVVTWPVLTETCHILSAFLGPDAQLRFIDGVRAGACRVFSHDMSHLDRVQELMDKYRDLPMDLTDASLVILAEELGTGRILSTDRRDFQTYRWKHRKPFKNLLAT
jgi:uncharacterized protein